MRWSNRSTFQLQQMKMYENNTCIQCTYTHINTQNDWRLMEMLFKYGWRVRARRHCVNEPRTCKNGCRMFEPFVSLNCTLHCIALYCITNASCKTHSDICKFEFPFIYVCGCHCAFNRSFFPKTLQIHHRICIQFSIEKWNYQSKSSEREKNCTSANACTVHNFRVDLPPSTECYWIFLSDVVNTTLIFLNE